MALPQPYAFAQLTYASPGSRAFTAQLWYTIDDVAGVPLVAAGALATEIDDVIGNALLACLPATCSYLGTFVRVYHTSATYTAVADANRGDGGMEDEQFLPVNDVVCIAKFTDNPGRAARGRWFFSCVGESSAADNFVSVTGAALYIALAEQLTMDVNTEQGAWTPCHHDRKHALLLPIIGFQVDRQIKRADRRRLRSPV